MWALFEDTYKKIVNLSFTQFLTVTDEVVEMSLTFSYLTIFYWCISCTF